MSSVIEVRSMTPYLVVIIIPLAVICVFKLVLNQLNHSKPDDGNRQTADRENEQQGICNSICSCCCFSEKKTSGAEIHNEERKSVLKGHATQVTVKLNDHKLEFFRDLFEKIGLKNRKDYNTMSANVGTIIVVGNNSGRLNEAVQMCCKDISDSDVKRTIVVIVYRDGNIEDHGLVMKNEKKKENEYGRLKDLKGIIMMNYECCATTSNCDLCLGALEKLKEMAMPRASEKLGDDKAAKDSITTHV